MKLNVETPMADDLTLFEMPLRLQSVALNS
jgi:hypothetical protein